MNADDTDPYLLTLGQIAAELTAIRQELQQRSGDSPDDPLETFECRCGTTVSGEQAAKQHAKTDHGAPDGAWRDLYE